MSYANPPGRLLLIGSIPEFNLHELLSAVRNVIYWEQHTPYTREQRIARDRAFVCLMQAEWHLADAIKGQRVVAEAA